MSTFGEQQRDAWQNRGGADDGAGLYRAAYEHDACGVGFVADITGRAGTRALTGALRALDNLVHRGAIGADARTSDGAGVLTQIPARFFGAVVPALAGRTPALGDFAVGQLFLSQDETGAARARALVEAALARQGLPLLGWRVVPVRAEVLGDEARAALPRIEQVIAARPEDTSVDEFERRLALARREAEKGAGAAGIAFYAVSFSARTIVYKGLLIGGDLAAFYPDLADPRYETAVAIFHQRYSTNTAPTWTLAQPFRLLAHNGEINTVQGNRRWMAAREPGLRAAAWGDRLPELRPVVQEGGSDSASLDNVLDLLVRSGYGLLEALATTVGEAWEHRDDLDAARRAFYEYHAPLMEPWDGPAGLAFSDGAIVGAALDRNGLRPARYRLTDDGLLIVASEAGVLEPAGQECAAVLESGRLGPGQMIAVDLANGRLLRHDDILGELAARHPYREWIAARHVTLESAEQGNGERGTRNAEQETDTDNGDAADGGPDSAFRVPRSALDLVRAQTRFGYSAEDLRLILTPMGADGHEAVWSMGDDAPFAILSDKPHGLADYFRQRFAQVTNPPIDPLRERSVMSLDTYLGPRGGLLTGLLEEDPAPGRLVHLASPVLGPGALARTRIADCGLRIDEGAVATLPAFFDTEGGGAALASALEQLQAEAVRAIDNGATILVVSDDPAQSAIRNPQSAIPLLLAVAAVHQGLIAAGRRLDAEIVAEAGDAWSTHHVATLIAYGAAAVCPWVACASARALATVPEDGDEAATRDRAEAQYLAALDEGLRKIMSKMGISALRSYHGSGLFEALGLSEALIDAYFPGTPSPLGGIGLEEIAADVAAREAAVAALPEPDGKKRVSLPDHGFIRFRRDGERHAYPPTVAKALQGLVNAVDGATEEAAARYLGLTESSASAPLTIRDLLALRPAGPPVPLDEVEPVEAIRPRFIATAMSLGALSPEAYTTLAAGMNRMGARSNSGEGGEDPDWYAPQPDGERRHSKIKQIASGRFGVTANYLVHAEEIEIKMAQGSKPGEGGQLPAHKVTDLIARLRHAVPGTSLISPPPHHDIYSIEDIAQLIFDLRTVQPTAKIGVKLVATSGVGTIAAGVAKAGANYVLVSGHSGGTGASPLSSIKHVGLPWELGLAEAQQTLIRSGLRDRVRLRTDGGLRTARDVIVAAALGAEDYGFGTAALIALGCDMARQCHLNTCPTGIATQRADLRAKFTGKPEQVVTYFTWLAEGVRAELAALGLRSLDEAIGRVALLAQIDRIEHTRAATLNLSRLLAAPPAGAATRSNPALGPLASPVPLSERLLDAAAPALGGVAAVALSEPIRNRDRAIGAELAGALARRQAVVARGGAAPAPVTLELTGSAGQSFGAFAVAGLTLRLTGEANDYVGKGISGGTIAIGTRNAERGTRNNEAQECSDDRANPIRSAFRVPRSAFVPRVLVGNTVLYGATGGELFVAGAAGERFAVRNSGATAVVEGVGDHGCEYMTGGTVLVLGPTGRNFAAGMSEGRAFILDKAGDFPARCNQELVNLTRLSADADELATVRDLLERHLTETGSARARAILADWGRYAGAFWLVTGKPPVPVAEPTPAGRPARAPRPGNGRAPIAVRRVEAEREEEREPVSATVDD